MRGIFNASISASENSLLQFPASSGKVIVQPNLVVQDHLGRMPQLAQITRVRFIVKINVYCV